MGIADAAESESLSVKKTLKSDRNSRLSLCRLGSEKGTSECS